MNEWDELQKRNWGEPHKLPDPHIYAEVLKEAIAQAIASQHSMHVVHVKLTITSPELSLTAELTYTPVQPPALPAPKVEGIILGEDDDKLYST